MPLRIQPAPFDMPAELEAFEASCPGAGAIVSFTGIVRPDGGGDLERMEIEHYPGMCEAAIGEFMSEAGRRWALAGCLVIHRVGTLLPGERIMMVATASRRRKAAFESAEFLMDYLKSRAPFWKKEIAASGARWVESAARDEGALSRWSG